MKPSTKRHLYVVWTIAKDTAKITAFVGGIAGASVTPGYVIALACIDPAVGDDWYASAVLFSSVFWFVAARLYGLAREHKLFEKTRKALESRYDRASERFPDVAPEPGDLELADDAQTMKGGLGR